MLRSLVGSEMCIRDRYQRRVRGQHQGIMGCGGSKTEEKEKEIGELKAKLAALEERNKFMNENSTREFKDHGSKGFFTHGASAADSKEVDDEKAKLEKAQKELEALAKKANPANNVVLDDEARDKAWRGVVKGFKYYPNDDRSGDADAKESWKIADAFWPASANQMTKDQFNTQFNSVLGDKAEEAFAVFDADSSGILDRMEFFSAMDSKYADNAVEAMKWESLMKANKTFTK
eukprot:TRINITY_DN6_c0_g1_i11.p2 TRINITY_DN6_c0_g1~~TRINITY_DN6_c0_g1_i11.p2  ORF type:complete len:233 (-),score=101.40 TRINITY_DN6_c0_g1_i11:316-1014(-)